MVKKIVYSFLIFFAGLLMVGLAIYLFTENDDTFGTGQHDYLLVNDKQTTSKQLFLDAWDVAKENYIDQTLNQQDWKRWKKHYKRHIKTDEDAYVAINSMLASLNDPYTKFMSTEEYDNQNINIEAKLTGIGINMVSVAGKVIVVSVIEDTPAFNAGLKQGDIVLKADGKDLSGLNIEEVAKIIRGPINSSVNLIVLRDKKKHIFDITRAEIELKNVRSKILKNNVGYIQISTFIGANMAAEFFEAFTKVQDTKGLIIDLRGNMGGLLPNALYLSNLFVPEGTIVKIVDRKDNITEIMAQEKEFNYNKPIVILINEASASASEIFSGALKDNNKAMLVGKKTFGKGMVQKVFPLPNKTGMNLTIAKYLTPNGTDINSIGILPDVEVELNQQYFLNGNDPQLKKAINIIRLTFPPPHDM